MYWFSKKLNKIYYFKHQALLEDQNMEFHMGPLYDNYDWTVEPTDSWKQVLKSHALKLREKYKYLRLWYSGGSDSQTVLNTFVDNKIHLDEIAIVRMSPIDNFNHDSEQEQNRVAIPQVRAIANQIPKTNVALYNLGYKEYKNWITNHFILDRTNIRSFHMFLPTNIHKLIPGINDRIRLGNINCVEPARLGEDEKGVYWYFVDTALWENITSPQEEKLVKQEKFYMDPIVHAKQCFLIKHNNRYSGYTPENFNDEKWFNENIKGVCRDDLFAEITMGKNGGRYFGNPKSQMAVEAALSNPETKHLVVTYKKIMMDHGLDLKHFNNRDPIKGYLGRLTKKYYISLKNQ